MNILPYKKMPKKNTRGNTVVIIIIVVGLVAALLFTVATKQQSTRSSETPVSEKEQAADEQGAVIAGQSSPFIVFNKAEYEKARASGKIILLNFYANWCPICRGEEPDIKAGFDSLKSDKLIGFRVNYNDSETDADEKALAQEFNVPYQHTKIILKDTHEVARSGEVWDKDTFLQEVGKFGVN